MYHHTTFLSDVHCVSCVCVGVPVPSSTHADLLISAEALAGDIITTSIPVATIGDLPELPSLVGVDGDTERSVVLTSPPTDLSLSWNATLISSATVDITLSVVTSNAVNEAGFEDAATLASGVANVGFYVIPAADLSEINLANETFVFFKVSQSANAFFQCICPSTA